jgi:hypothetical protein
MIKPTTFRITMEAQSVSTTKYVATKQIIDIYTFNQRVRNTS